MLTEIQKQTIITMALTAFKAQKGIILNPADFELYIDKPNTTSLCSLYLNTKRTDDHFRIKLYVTEFVIFSNVENFRLTQEQNYSTGYNDEVHVANIKLDKSEFRSFQQYLLSNQFIQDTITSTDRIMSEDGSGYVLAESNGYILAEH